MHLPAYHQTLTIQTDLSFLAYTRVLDVTLRILKADTGEIGAQPMTIAGT